ncbi:hypothetical protein DV738_g468, partial [Chaetothyriales sp. CBS 135597]
MSFAVQRLFIYPVKSLRPVEVDSVELTNEGLRFDRSFILVNPPEKRDQTFAKFLTIKRVYKLALLQPRIDETWTKLSITNVLGDPEDVLTVPLTPSPLFFLRSKSYQVSIFGTSAIGVDVGDAAAKWFSKHIGQNVRMLHIGGSGRREIPGAAYIGKQVNALSLALKEGLQPQRIRFADAAPLLVTSTSSEEETKSRLPPDFRREDIILRLRPNIHIDVRDLPAFDEDHWSTLVINTGPNGSEEVTVKCIFKCVRCLSLNASPETGQMIMRERQLYGLLAKDRRVNEKFPQKPVFGQYAFAGPAGAFIRTGDKVKIAERSDSFKTPSHTPVATPPPLKHAEYLHQTAPVSMVDRGQRLMRETTVNAT